MKQRKSPKSAEELITSQDLIFEESEEISDGDAVTWSNEPGVSEGMNVEEFTPAVSEQVARSPAASEEHFRLVQDLREEEEESTGSEGEDGGAAREDRKDVASGNGTCLGAALFRCQAEWNLQDCLASQAKRVRTWSPRRYSRISGAGF